MADYRDKLERERQFGDDELERLASLERSLVSALGDFHEALPEGLKRLYGNAGTPKLINFLEYSRTFHHYHCINLLDTGMLACFNECVVIYGCYIINL